MNQFVPETISSNRWYQWVSVMNPDWTLIGTEPNYTTVAYYDNTDLTYDIEYYCQAYVWTELETNEWRVFRLRYYKTDWKLFDRRFAWNWKFEHPATDLAAVQALTYS